MNEKKNQLFGNDAGNIQISHDEYTSLMEQLDEVKRLNRVKDVVLSDLRCILGEASVANAGSAANDSTASQPQPKAQPQPQPKAQPQPQPEAQSKAVEKVEYPEPIRVKYPEPIKGENKNSEPPQKAAPQQPDTGARSNVTEIPPVKDKIAEHFNKLDESGRLFNVFKQYYTCLNESCGGTVRVTMKDGFCSLWNYDEWEEFAFVDIFEGLLRIAIDPRYTDALKSLSLCEVPRLISSRRNVICVQVDDLNNIVLDVLTKAFNEVGMQV